MRDSKKAVSIFVIILFLFQPLSNLAIAAEGNPNEGDMVKNFTPTVSTRIPFRPPSAREIPPSVPVIESPISESNPQTQTVSNEIESDSTPKEGEVQTDAPPSNNTPIQDGDTSTLASVSDIIDESELGSFIDELKEKVLAHALNPKSRKDPPARTFQIPKDKVINALTFRGEGGQNVLVPLEGKITIKLMDNNQTLVVETGPLKGEGLIVDQDGKDGGKVTISDYYKVMTYKLFLEEWYLTYETGGATVKRHLILHGDKTGTIDDTYEIEFKSRGEGTFISSVARAFKNIHTENTTHNAGETETKKDVQLIYEINKGARTLNGYDRTDTAIKTSESIVTELSTQEFTGSFNPTRTFSLQVTEGFGTYEKLLNEHSVTIDSETGKKIDLSKEEKTRIVYKGDREESYRSEQKERKTYFDPVTDKKEMFLLTEHVIKRNLPNAIETGLSVDDLTTQVIQFASDGETENSHIHIVHSITNAHDPYHEGAPPYDNKISESLDYKTKGAQIPETRFFRIANYFDNGTPVNFHAIYSNNNTATYEEIEWVYTALWWKLVTLKGFDADIDWKEAYKHIQEHEPTLEPPHRSGFDYPDVD